MMVTSCDPNGMIVLIGHTRHSLERNVLRPMRKLYSETMVGMMRDDGRVRLFCRDAIVLGADTEARAKALQGMSVAYAYGDEVATWSRAVFMMLASRLDRAGSRFDGTCNPEGPGHWLKAFLDGGADVYVQHYTLEDNPALPEAFKRNLMAEYAGSVLYDRYILGKWTKAEGLVYRGFDAGRHVVEAAGEIRRIVFGVDVGHANATAFVALGDGVDGRRYVLAEYLHSGRESGEARSPLGYARDFVAFRERTLGMYAGSLYGGVVVDPSAAGFIAQLREVGERRVYRARNGVLDGIAAVASAFDGDRLRVLRGCDGIVREIGGYVWDSAAAARGEDRPVKVDDHLLDALRYALRRMGD